MPALPVPDTGKVNSFSVWNSQRSMALLSSMTLKNSGSRWPTTGAESASRTRGCGLLGPGPRRILRGGFNVGAMRLLLWVACDFVCFSLFVSG